MAMCMIACASMSLQQVQQAVHPPSMLLGMHHRNLPNNDIAHCNCLHGSHRPEATPPSVYDNSRVSQFQSSLHFLEGPVLKQVVQ